MKKGPLIFLIFIFLLSFSFDISAQTKKSASADQAFDRLQYQVALVRYKKAYSRSKGNKAERNRITFRMGECARLMNDYKRALPFYKRLISNKYDREEPLVLLYYADALRATGKYDEALEQYQAYSEKMPDDPRGQLGQESCALAKEWAAEDIKLKAINEKKLNSKDDEFSPSFSETDGNSIIFTSTREGTKGKKKDEWTGKSFSDLFTVKKDRKGVWSVPVSIELEGGINTEANEGQASFDSKFTRMYFTRCPNAPGKTNGCQIYVTKRSARSFGEPEMLELSKDSTVAIGHPAVTPDESMIVFSSNRNGGAGGRDLWMAVKGKSGGKFTAPKNLGELINTPGDEVFPFLRGDSVLYFSSNGHPGMGGLDLFKCVKDEEGNWTAPVNMKPPFNSNFDDFGITFAPNGDNEGYFSSNRTGGKGGDDIYSFVIPPLLFTISGTIKDDQSLLVIPDASVKLVGSDGSSFVTKSDEKGFYTFTNEQVKKNTTYEITVNADKYFNEKALETTVGLTFNKDLIKNFRLKPLPEKPIVLPDILYDLAKWDLKPQYQDSLQGLIETLDINPTIVVELASHTDSRDIDERNDILSQKRAESVVNYLIERGIDADRLVAKGYGERVPRTILKDVTKEGFTFAAGSVLNESYINSLPNEKVKEAAHQMNRRTEFSIIRKDYVPKATSQQSSTGKIDIVTNTVIIAVPYTVSPGGNIQSTCIINGFTLNFQINKQAQQATISLGSALRLLKERAISRDDFQGDPEEILAEGTIADKAVFNVKTFKIGKKSVSDFKFMVDYNLKEQIEMGPAQIQLLGKYRIDEPAQRIVFE